MSKRSFSLSDASNEKGGSINLAQGAKRLKRSVTVAAESNLEIQTKDASIHTASSVERIPYSRDEVLPRSLSSNKNDFVKIVSWNVNGLRALVSKKFDVLENLIKNHEPDILCLQETKIQESAIPDFEGILPEYHSVWSCSTVKKGYSGTAIFFRKSSINIPAVLSAEESLPKKKQATLGNYFIKAGSRAIQDDTKGAINTTSGAGENLLLKLNSIFRDFEDWQRAHEGEGRTITAEFDQFYLVACYVPNSGESLARLDYRVNEWDPFLAKYVSWLRERKPVVFTGDLNVGHMDIDIHNPDAKHILKQAGLTPQERSSFSTLLASTGCIDAFRFFHPDKIGQFTYWSQRTFARPVNRGLRLDYFVCSPDLFPNGDSESTSHSVPVIYDSYILHNATVGCSDHCPIVLVLKIR